MQILVPQESVLEPTLHLIYAPDLPTTYQTATATFIDDTAFSPVSDNLTQVSLNH